MEVELWPVISPKIQCNGIYLVADFGVTCCKCSLLFMLTLHLLNTTIIIFNPYAAGTVYPFEANSIPINSTRVAKMFSGRCLVNL